MKVVHIINSLDDGGAEHTLFKICKYDINNEHIVISLKGSGKYFILLKNLGIAVYCLNANFFSFYKFFFLIKLLSSLKPDIVQTWLVHSDLIGSIAARLAGIKNVIWNIRYSNLKFGKAKLTTIIMIKLLAKLSFFIPKYIIVVSKRAKKIYENKGFDKKKLKLIFNGYDLSILKPNKFLKINFKKKIKIKKKIALIGNVARYDPKKDHSNLLNALSLIRLKNLDFFCVLVGSNIDQNNVILSSEIKKLKLSNYIKLLGKTDNILQVMNGLDVYVQSSSYGEGFPNVLAESMACGTPCIATDVGDSSYILGKTGWVVPPNNPTKLAKAIQKSLIELGTKNWNRRCNKARLKIMENFNVLKMVKSYNKLWNKIYQLN
jgi:glycosyltransferase involved in cell wall biosynthesis